MPESARFEKLPVWKIHGVENSGLELPAPVVSQFDFQVDIDDLKV